MSLITRCPTCETMFRVVPDQIRVSEGWVRCGQCAAVFDATQNMVASPEAAGAAATAPVPAPTPVPQTTGQVAEPTPTQPTRWASTPASTVASVAMDGGAGDNHPWTALRRPASPAAPALAPDTPAAAHTTAEAPTTAAARATADRDAPPAVVTAAEQEDDWLDAPLTDPQTVILATEDDDEELLDTVPPPAPPTTRPGSSPWQRDAADPDASAVPRPSFLRDDANKASIWRRPAVRIALVVVLLVLLSLLAGQFLIKERNRVAAVEPALQPVLHAVCAIAGCTVAPLRQIESIVIDSSSFSRVRDDNYHLGFSLKNTAPIDVAMPAIELSLTDPQDQPVIRRVILPAEFGARTPVLARSAVWSGSMALTVRSASDTQRIAGYRLLAFYP